MAREKLVVALTIILAVALAAGMAYAATDEGPPGIINVDGAVYYTGGIPVESCTPVTVELHSPTGELKQKKELCTGQYFPPLDEYRHMYKLTFAGSAGKDMVTVRALGITNSSVAQEFTAIDITGSKPGIVTDIGKAVNYVIGLIVPKKAAETPTQPGRPVQPGTPAPQQPAIPDDVAGASFLLLLTAIAAALIMVALRRKKGAIKGTASHRLSLALLLVSIILLGSLWFSGMGVITTLEGGQNAIEGGKELPAQVANQTPSGKQQIIVEGGFPTGRAVEGEEGGGQIQIKYSVLVNDPDVGFMWGPNGEHVMNTTWADWFYIANDTKKCGDNCNPIYGNCTIVKFSLIRNNATHTLIQNRTLCAGQGYPYVGNATKIYDYYYRFRTVLTTEDDVAQNQYTVNITANNYTLEGKNSTIGADTVYIDVTLSQAASGVPPTWSNNQSAYPSVYNPTNASNFTIKWTDNGVVSTVLFESDFSGSPQNYTMIQLGNNFYNYNNTLPAGNFYWKSYATDNSGDQAVSDTWYFTILQATNPVTLFFRNSTGEYVNQEMTITYPAQSNATAQAVAGATINRDDVYKGGATEINVLGGGAYLYKANATGNQNYSANFTGIIAYLYVNPAANILNLYLNGNKNQDIIVNYGTTINSTGAGPDGVTVSRNDTIIPNGQVIKLAASRYAYKVNSTGNGNYTENATGATFIAYVNRVVALVNLNFVPSGSVTYGTQTTANCLITSGDPGATLILYRNGTEVNSSAGGVSETKTLGAGVYNYTCVYLASENYSSGYDTNYLTITPAASNVLQGMMHVLINDVESDQSFQYENVTNVTGYSTITGQGGLTFNLYRNGASAGSSSSEPYGVPDIKQLGVLTYTYIYNTTGNQNYSAASVTRTLTITKKTLTLSLSTAGTVNYGSGSGVSGSSPAISQADYTLQLSVSGIGVIATDSSYPYSVSDNTVYGAGGYTFTLSNSASANYTAASTTADLTVNPIQPALALAVMPSNNVMYPTITNATGTVVAGDPSATTQLWRNGTNVGTKTETIRLGAGTYNYTFVYLASQNYTAYSILNLTTIQQNNTNPLDLSINNGTSIYTNQDVSVNYGTSVTVQGSSVYPQSGTVSITRDGQNATNPVTVTLGGGAHAFQVTSTGNTNYTANATGATYYVIVSPVTPTVAVNFVPSDSVNYGTQTTATCTITVGDQTATLTLIRNGTSVNTSTGSVSETKTLGGGVYNYTCVYLSSQNYTAGYSYNNYLTVTPAAAGVLQGTMHVLINDVESDQAFQYETTTNVTGYSTQAGQSGLTFDLYRNGALIGSNGAPPYAVPDVGLLDANTYTYIYNTTGNQNYSAASVTRTLTITKKTPTLSLSTAGTISYGAGSGVSGSSPAISQADYSINLYVNGKGPISTDSSFPYNGISDNTVYGGGSYTFTLNNSASTNYNAASTTAGLTVNPIAPTIALSVSPDNSTTYGTTTTATGTVLAGDQGATTQLSRNGSVVGTATETIKLGAGAYKYTFTYTGSQNYSALSTDNITVITSVPSSVDLTISPSDTVMYPTTTTATGTVTTGDPGATTQLLRDGTPVGTYTETVQLDTGIYNYTFVYLGSQNYTTSSKEKTATIQQNTTNLLNLYINNGTSLYINQDVTVTYGTPVTVQGLNAFPNSGTVSLYRDGQSTTNPVTITLGGGTHPFKTNSTGNANYVPNATGVTYNVVVNKAIPSTSITFDPSDSVAYGTPVTTTCSVTTGDPGATLRLLRNGTEVNMSLNSVSETAVLGAGVYNYSCKYDASENYTSYTNTDVYLTVTQVAGSCSLNINPATPITYGTATNASCSCTGTPNLYRNHSAANAENNANIVLPAGFWNYTCNTTASGNTTGASASQGYQVNQASALLTLLLNGTDGDFQYLNATFARFTINTATSGLPVSLYTNYSDGTNKLWDSGVSPFTNVTNLTEFGVWNFTAYFAGNANYTANSTTHYATVSEMRPNPVGNLTIMLNTTSNDTMLNWTLSNSSDVYNYIIYVTDNYDAGFNFNNPYATASNTTTNWTDPTSDGVNERYYVVRVNNSLGLTDLNTYVVGKWNLHLYTGWNLISIPLLLDDNTLNNVIYTADHIDICERYNAVSSTFERTDYFAGSGWSGEFDTIEVDRGYWYFSRKAGYETTPFNVTIVGVVPTATREEEIAANAWSLLGWTSIHTKTLDSVFTQSKHKDVLELYEPVTDVFQRTDYFGGLGWFGEFDYITPGYGYWYYSKNATAYNWTYQP